MLGGKRSASEASSWLCVESSWLLGQSGLSLVSHYAIDVTEQTTLTGSCPTFGLETAGIPAILFNVHRHSLERQNEVCLTSERDVAIEVMPCVRRNLTIMLVCYCLLFMYSIYLTLYGTYINFN